MTYRRNLPYNPKLVERARELRRNMTPAEKELWYGLLRQHRPRFYRQRPIDNFIVDFYCPKLHLVIEVDGDSHAGDEAQAYDAERSAVLEGYGLTVLRFANGEVLEDLEGVRKRIDASSG